MLRFHPRTCVLVALSIVLVACRDAPAPPAPNPPPDRPSSDVPADVPGSTAPARYVARGQEPGWSVELDGEAIAWRPMGGAEAVYSHADRQGRGEAFTVSGTLDGGTLALTAERRTCRDPMSGMPHPDTVVVEVDGRTYEGCGGEPIDLLAAHAWTAVSITGTTLDASPPTLAFTATGDASGFAGCNRWSAAAALTGEGLSFRQAVTTMMACPEPAMAIEQAFLAALATVTRHDIDDAGQLVLLAGDTAVITATPAPAMARLAWAWSLHPPTCVMPHAWTS